MGRDKIAVLRILYGENQNVLNYCLTNRAKLSKYDRPDLDISPTIFALTVVINKQLITITPKHNKE